VSEEVSQIKRKLEEHEERISRLEKLLETKPKDVQKKLSIREFILSKNPKDEVQKTLAIGYYLEKYEDLTSFNAKDLENGFRSAKEKIPGNINYKVIRNIQKGYMMEAKEKKEKLKAWYLTNSGEKYVENNFE
jgi:5-bromo-4-chloroindolyl phosphate hydrolysis protein